MRPYLACLLLLDDAEDLRINLLQTAIRLEHAPLICAPPRHGLSRAGSAVGRATERRQPHELCGLCYTAWAWMQSAREPRKCTAVLKAPAEVSTAGSALNWRHVACEAGRRNRLAPEEHASLAHLVAGNARDHIVAVPSVDLSFD